MSYFAKCLWCTRATPTKFDSIVKLIVVVGKLSIVVFFNDFYQKRSTMLRTTMLKHPPDRGWIEATRHEGYKLSMDGNIRCGAHSMLPSILSLYPSRRVASLPPSVWPELNIRRFPISGGSCPYKDAQCVCVIYHLSVSLGITDIEQEIVSIA